MNRNQRLAMLLGLLAIGAAILGCANNSRVETVAYEDELDAARQSVRAAEQAGATEYGNAELSVAREKIRAAERAAQEGDGERVQRLATEAGVDADYAVAVNRNRETQLLVEEARANLRTLEEELRRSESSSLTSP